MRRIVSLMLVGLLLAACGNLPQPFSKNRPLPPGSGLVAPPWEAMVKAGPGAVNELDFETLNGPQAAAPSLAADSASPPAAATGARKEVKTAKPGKKATTTINAVVVLSVTGDSTKGNQQLAKAMRATLKKAGWPVRTKKAADTLVINGKVRIGQPRGAQQTVSLAWEVTDPSGKSLGLISQTNDVPSGSLAEGWGDNATAAVEAAATGIFALIDKLR